MTHNNGTYRAAAAQYKTEGTVGKIINGKAMTPMHVLDLNLNNYDKIANKAAKEDDAQIIIFPEFGLFGRSRLGSTPVGSRDLILPFAQSIPKVNTRILECYDEHVGDDGDITLNVVVRLARIASAYKIVVVANVAEVVRESFGVENDIVRIYNTEVAISEDGILLGKYYKMNPFFKKTFDKPPPSQRPVIFKTYFGVDFGMFVCKDIFHAEPQKQLLAAGIRHFPYSVAMPNNWLSRWIFKL
mmetsp:Transcript_6067/g.8924  ORF Transcript_6067/g.8924 Transcript_6067/m.8924 type:complete len:243 (+) Transcript_6067:7-735(+)